MILITFTTPTNGKVYEALLLKEFTLSDFIHAVPVLGNLSKYRLLINDQILCLDNEAIFNRQKHLVCSNVQITVLSPAAGGTFIEISLLKEMLLEDLKNEWTKIDLHGAICDFCMCIEMCATIHRTDVCSDCFPNYLKDTNFELRCTRQIVDRNDLYRVSHRTSSSGNDLVLCKPKCPSETNNLPQKSDIPRDQAAIFCESTVDYRTFFKTTEFIDRWSILCDTSDLLKNIDCQICYCGALSFNMTMSAKQQCSTCQRWLCFFCNRTWNPQTMKDLMYTCTNECEYERRIHYDLVPLLNAPTIMVPDRRCCPKCFLAGGYGTAYMINIHFNYLGRHYLGQLKRNFNLNDLQQLVSCYFKSPSDYRFIISGKELDLFNTQSFARCQSLFNNGVSILVLERIRGGGFVEIQILTNIILQDLEKALEQLPTTNNEERPCQVCRDNTNCMKLCCNRICKVCFGDYFAHSTFKLRCMTCHQQVPYDRFFVSPDFVRCLESLTEICELMKYIDCQICHCGSLVVNETLYAQQTCANCKRTFCFFCNKGWNEGLIHRKNAQYTCHVSCDYETKLSFELIPLQCKKDVLIPNRRFCPSCFTFGSYDEKCKYHACPTCAHSFCFICLEEEETCKTKYGSNYQHKCTDVKKQTYSDFPTIAKRS